MENRTNGAREIDVFNRYSRHNKLRVWAVAIILGIIAVVSVYFFFKSILTYTITFVADGGTVYGKELESEYKYSFLEKTRIPEGLKKEGYYIDGFYTDEEMTEEYKFGSRIWNSKTIYIDWQPGYAVQLSFVAGEDTRDRLLTDQTGVDEIYLKNYYEQYVKPGSEYTLPDVYNNVEDSIHYGEKLYWYYNQDGKGEPINTYTFTVDKNIPIYGKWFDVQEFKFDVDENGILQRYLGRCKNIILPNNIKGIKDIAPGDFDDGEWDTNRVMDGSNYSAFDRVLDDLKILYINENMETLGRCAFRYCKNLEIVKFLGNKITEIPDSCFLSCLGLKEVTLPKSVITIGKNAFNDVRNIKEVKGLDNVEEVDVGAFANCYRLEKLVFNKLDIIHSEAFAMCIGLKELHLYNEYGVGFNNDVTYDIFLGAGLNSNSSQFKIYIPVNDALLTYYQTADIWSVYADRFEYI